MPMPQLKVRSASASSSPPSRISQPKTGGSAQAPRSISTPSPAGSTRGTFSVSPPPVMCAAARTPPCRIAASTGRT